MAFDMRPFNHSFFNMEPSDFFKDFGRHMLDDAFTTSHIKTDIKELDDAYVVEAELPGMDKENIQLKFENNVLTITAQHSVEDRKEDEEGRMIRQERHFSNMQRSFTFNNVDENNIKASYQNGMLNVTLGKRTPGRSTNSDIPID
ncbi:Hsp20/alpha crystallin family protein [Staphylococcus intermedius]|uniref:Small heat shock protein n=1 Tax=Staphylococcus intermedius NCTC 11048 TaxID=1141106 RepID=A0A380G3M4_STAIN|nr:Hsp20/alpha crystallin family protein [Staphylococcus intermedius]PCF64086.1 heat-shock protein [Staphylococcus intermedius]PCF78802.1 heat-shock protein [Staphylococcus intermedius]PCF79774.1 heat-shock protein [Staphylococcus intermedius]PCF85875.1 heat-shock protein [Staphylococcus intermedius]PCF89567.1 heat-shock protein [Staphylococcus intermedius]